MEYEPISIPSPVNISESKQNLFHIKFRLTKENISGIVELLLGDLNRRLADRQLSISLTDEAKQYVIENGYDPVYGARPLKRYLQQHVETLAARIILSGDVREGSVILIELKDGALCASVQ